MDRRIGGAAAGLGVAASWLSARGIPVSPVFGGGRVGADFGVRRGLAGERVTGELADFGVLARPGFDPECVHPEIRRFYEETLDYRMWYDAHWHRGFRAGAAGATRVTSHLEQLALPGPGERGPRELESDLYAVPADADGREDVRLWTRTDAETGDAVFVALYATHAAGGARFVNVAVPLPGSNLSTVLRPDHLGAGDETGLELTTFAPGDPGLFAVTPAGAFRLPMQQRFRTWPADAPGAPTPPVEPVDLVTTQELWVAGCQFLTLRYGMRRRQTSNSTT